MESLLIVRNENDQLITKIHASGQISVRWTGVVDQAYAPVTPSKLAIIPFCRLLIAARDNFVVHPWDQPGDEPSYPLYDTDAVAVEIIPFTGVMLEKLTVDAPTLYIGIFPPMARINYDLSWSVRWSTVSDVARLPISNSSSLTRDGVLLISLCRLLLSAKDNFLTTPW